MPEQPKIIVRFESRLCGVLDQTRPWSRSLGWGFTLDTLVLDVPQPAEGMATWQPLFMQ